MAKIRINKLALELNIQNDQIIEALHKHDVAVKNHMSSIDEEAAQYIRELFTPKTAEPATTTKKVIKKAKAKIKIMAPSKVKVTTAKTQAKSTAAKKAEKKPDKKAEKTSKTKAETKEETKTVGKTAETAESKTGKKLGLKIVKKEDKPKPVEKKPAPAAKEKPAPATKEKPAAVTAPPVAPKSDPEIAVPEESFELVQIGENTPVRELAEKLKCTPNTIIKELMIFGILANINQTLNFDLASKVADKLGFEVELHIEKSELDFLEEEEDNIKDHISRAPIVTIMGHVDHGKTSLLDAIRKTDVTKMEAGGITQHIGAYQARIKGSSITFLDTPGHEAFTAMRARGAQVTDIVVLVVAADDGIKPQTKEAIHHAEAAGVPILVAINKIDKADAKPDEVKKQLADLGLLPEDWGGQTIYVEVSALNGTGIDHLLENLLLQAEVMELKANPSLRGRGVVIESRLDKGRGPIATMIIESGTLRVGEPFIVGCYFGKVRALVDDKGKKIKQAIPSTPVEVVGLPDVPQPGDHFMVVRDEKKARQLSSLRLQEQREIQLAKSTRITMDDLHQQIVEGRIKELNLIIKADVQGSIHAVQEAFGNLGDKEVRIKCIHDAVGGITESDVLLACASNAIIIGFNVRPTDQATKLATRDKVDIRLYSIIYDAINDMKQALQGMLAPKFKEIIVGKAEIREVFTIPKVGTIAGCHVLSGKIERNLEARLIRDSVVVYQGKIASIRRFKDDVKEVAAGYDCGISIEKFQDMKQGDVIEPFILEEIKH
ncbi:MAG: translation initiation factor IF-2 [Nitrospinae bacterium]|nr:translation initiation factor IF-2 [Nitrospinota bacterium]MBL7019729.1 translation initiation factor IF-2 [Nitrospinaceae bacterium]